MLIRIAAMGAMWRLSLAGQHVPICVEEILSVLSLQRGETVVDATLGYGGHSLAMVKRLGPFGRLIGLDADPLQLPKTQERLLAELQPRGAAQMLTTVHTNFRQGETDQGAQADGGVR